MGPVKSHQYPHLDELFGWWMIITFGRDRFPGGIPVLGDNFSKFDEHLPEGGRMENKCSATLVAEHLGLNKDLRFKDILEFVLNTDKHAPSHPFDLAKMVLTIRSNIFFRDTDFGWVYDWVKLAFDAWWKIVEKVKTLGEVREYLKVARKAFFDFRTVSSWNTSLSGGSIDQLLRVMNRQCADGTFESPYDIGAMTRLIAHAYDQDTARGWLERAISEILDQQRIFNEAVEGFRAEPPYQIQIGTKRESCIVIVGGMSDNPAFSKAARSTLGASIVLQANNNGNVIISCNSKRVSQRMMDAIARRIVEREPGLWYYHRPALSILNGAIGKEKPPTRMTFDEIADIVESTVQRFLMPRR